MQPIIGVIASAKGREPLSSGGGGSGVELDELTAGDTGVVGLNQDGTQYLAPGNAGVIDDE